MPGASNTVNVGSGPTLTKINYFGRLAVKYGLAFLVVLMVGRILLNAFVAFWKSTHPEPPPPPTVGFGVLPQPIFPEQNAEQKPQAYNLEIVGGLEEISDRAKVFLAVKNEANLLADDRVKTIAQIYGFSGEAEKLADQSYRFTKTTPLDSSLEISALDFSFNLRSNFLARPDLLGQNSQAPEEFEAVAEVKSFLQRSQLLGQDMATASGQVTFLRSIGGELTKADSLSEADFVQVDLNRNPVDGLYKLYTAEGQKGIVSAILTGAFSNLNSVLQMDYYYHPVDYLTVETYPLRSVKSAWKLVQSGDAYIASGLGLEEATVRQVELAYYDSYAEQPYLQPVYVFKGDNDFMAFVPAVSATYLAQSQ